MHPSKLHIVTMVSNPKRYESRYRLYRHFAREMEEAGVTLWTVEIAFGHRPFEVTCADNPHHLQLRTDSEIWHKENALNLVVQRLPADWEYLGWFDSDISFVKRHGNHTRGESWPEAILHSLQHHMLIQPWSHCIDLGPNGEHLESHTSFCYNYNNHKPRKKHYTFWHPGYAWAARREAWEGLGGLIDFAVLGAADHHMALSLIGAGDESLPGNISPAYKAAVDIWQARAQRFIRRDIGHLPWTLMHHWHGKKRQRFYVERWKIITDNHFDPRLDIARDAQGLYYLVDHGDMRSLKLRDDIREYFAARNEDSVDVD